MGEKLYTAHELLIEATRNSPTAKEMVESQILSSEDIGKIYRVVAKDLKIPVRFLMHMKERKED